MAQSDKVDFECKFALPLIEAVKEKPCIYSTTHPQYRSQSENDFAWFNIAQSLKRSPTLCVNKWYILLQRFLYQERLEALGLEQICTVKTDAYKAMVELKPHMVDRYQDLLSGSIKKTFTSKIPTKLQEELIKEIKVNSSILYNQLTTNERRQEVWSAIAYKLNKKELYAELPIINWQKVWWDLKTAIREKLEQPSATLSPMDKWIIITCGIRTNVIVDIIDQLKSFTEFDVFVVSRGVGQALRASISRFMSSQSTTDVRLCSLCSKSPAISIYKVDNWSPAAKKLLPLECQSRKMIFACVSCNLSLNQRASVAWKACRVCAATTKPLRNFQDKGLKSLIVIFRSISQLPLSQAEGLPSYVCDDCIDKLTELRNFCDMSTIAQRGLHRIHEHSFIGESQFTSTSSNTPSIRIDENTPIIFQYDDEPSIDAPAQTSSDSGQETRTLDHENDFEIVFIEPPPTVLNQSQSKAHVSPHKPMRKAVINLKRVHFKTDSTSDEESPSKIRKNRISVKTFASTEQFHSIRKVNSNNGLYQNGRQADQTGRL